MDPRTAATVTAPDLVQAFQEGTGRQEEPKLTDDMSVFVAFFAEESDTKAEVPVRTILLPAVQLGLALTEVASWLAGGNGRAVAMQLGTKPPEGWDELERALLSPPRD